MFTFLDVYMFIHVSVKGNRSGWACVLYVLFFNWYHNAISLFEIIKLF